MINPINLLFLQWQNYFDIIFVTVVIYSVYIWLRGTRAFHILIGLGGLGMLYFLTSWSGLFLTSWLLQYLLGVTLLLIIVIFQPEIRQLLEKVSPLAILKLKGGTIPRTVLSEVAGASFRLADERIGALFVFPRATLVSDVIQDGVQLDSLASQELLISIFQKNSPIHDGAVVIEKDRVVKAGCYLPLSTREGLPPKYGTRHRAALGVAEHGDTLCVVVSEERGVVSLAQKGEIETMTGQELLRYRLEQALSTDPVASVRSSVLETIQRRFNYQEFIRKNFLAKCLSTALACLLWFLLVGQQWSETFTSAILEYQNKPGGMDFTSEVASEIQVRVRGPHGSISSLDPDQIRVVLDLTDVQVGENNFTITDENLSLPFGLEATAITPRTLTIQLDRIVSRQYTVTPELVGSLSPEFRLAYIDVTPERIELSGPEQEMNQIERVTTPPIDQSTLTESAVIPCKVKIFPPFPYAFRSSIPEVMVSLSLIQEPVETEEEIPVSSSNSEARVLVHTGAATNDSLVSVSREIP